MGEEVILSILRPFFGLTFKVKRTCDVRGS
jgi:hypothetical protein